jgi:hypothetical protein
MTIYKCNNCFREFKQKCHLDNHKNKKKKPCVNKNVLNDIINPEDSVKLLHDIVNHGVLNTLNISNELVCKNYDRVFTKKDNLKIHVDKYCKKNKEFKNILDLKEIHKINDTPINHKMERLYF